MNKMPISIIRNGFFLCLLIGLQTISVQAAGQGGFTGGTTPSRFEISTAAGETIKKTISIYNFGKTANQFKVSTADWALSEQGKLSFQNELKANSCRPWVRLERHKVNVLPSVKKPRPFRFEVAIPENTPAQECRFAIMLSSLGAPYKTTVGSGGIAITGQIAIIVYLSVGDASPVFNIKQFSVIKKNDRWTPVVTIHNTGKAHGRLDGDFTAKDADNNALELFISNSPILAGQTREITLTADQSYQEKYGSIKFPLRLEGKLYTNDKTFDVDTTLTMPKGE